MLRINRRKIFFAWLISLSLFPIFNLAFASNLTSIITPANAAPPSTYSISGAVSWSWNNPKSHFGTLIIMAFTSESFDGNPISTSNWIRIKEGESSSTIEHRNFSLEVKESAYFNKSYYLLGILYIDKYVSSFIDPDAGDKIGEYADGFVPKEILPDVTPETLGAPAGIWISGSNVNNKDFSLSLSFKPATAIKPAEAGMPTTAATISPTTTIPAIPTTTVKEVKVISKATKPTVITPTTKRPAAAVVSRTSSTLAVTTTTSMVVQTTTTTTLTPLPAEAAKPAAEGKLIPYSKPTINLFIGSKPFENNSVIWPGSLNLSVNINSFSPITSIRAVLDGIVLFDKSYTQFRRDKYNQYYETDFTLLSQNISQGKHLLVITCRDINGNVTPNNYEFMVAPTALLPESVNISKPTVYRPAILSLKIPSAPGQGWLIISSPPPKETIIKRVLITFEICKTEINVPLINDLSREYLQGPLTVTITYGRSIVWRKTILNK